MAADEVGDSMPGAIFLDTPFVLGKFSFSTVGRPVRARELVA